MLPYQTIQLWNQTKNKRKFESLLIEKGFSVIGSGDRSLVFSRRDIDYVVKISTGLVSRPFQNSILEKFRLPYIFLNGNHQIGLQLKASRRTKSSRYRAWKKIRDAANVDLDVFDIHQDNVGWINRKPVIFDY